ncbi:MAG: molybdopterin-dependent oxidoreductase, partial [Deltaproteobacteria bacterium]|nr:molybdopterin-dependent oxidoreductase [Deltaproteobacteria bacterium]
MPAEPTETRISVCSHDCPDACSLRVTVREGRLVSLRGDPAHPITQGILCGKVSRYAERVFHPRRILTPQRRVGAKGEGRFQPVSWEEALDEIAARFTAIIREHGAQAILPFSYGGTVGHLGFNAGHPFFHALGASRLDRTICVGTATAGLRATTGIGAAADLEQVVDAKLILLWGLNAVATHVHLMPLLKRARAKGAQVVVIDPYRTATARQAHRWLQIRPGTDAALAMGLMRELLALGLHDRAFIAQYTHGFEALRESCQPYTPEHTEALTGIPAAEVRALARDYGGTRDSFIRLGLGMSRHAGGGMAVRTVACLPAVTGAWEGAAGGLLGLSWSGMWLDTGILTRPRPEHPGARLVNMVRLGEALTALDNPPVKALYVYNANPAATVPHQSLVQQGLAREDLFVVVHEQMPTDTVDYADLVLPATNFLEHDDLLSGYGHDYLQYSRP